MYKFWPVEGWDGIYIKKERMGLYGDEIKKGEG